MANTKKELKHESVSEKALRLGVNIGVNLIALIVTAFIFWIPQECNGIDNEFLYCRVHPFGLFDFIGYVLFLFCCFWLSGVWVYVIKYIVKDFDDAESIWGTITKLAWLAGVAGCLFMYFL
jgi:hypothetical protein